jgi:hypothetical protein
VKTRHLESDQLQYAFWRDRLTVLGWWKPSAFAKLHGKGWTSFWTHMVKPVMKYFVERQTRRIGWEGRYQRYIDRLEKMNHFPDLEKFSGK